MLIDHEGEQISSCHLAFAYNCRLIYTKSRISAVLSYDNNCAQLRTHHEQSQNYTMSILSYIAGSLSAQPMHVLV